MRRTVLLTILLLLVIYIYRTGIPTFGPRPASRPESELTGKIAASAVATGYILPEDDEPAWLRFPLAPAARLVKVLTNAGLPPSIQNDIEQRFWYKLRYRIEDGNGRILAEEGYHHYTGLTLYHDPQTGDRAAPRFYLDKAIIPADGKTMFVNFDNYPDFGSGPGPEGAPRPEPAYILFRLEWKDPLIRDVLIRAYTEEKVSERKLGYLWRRLSGREKTFLARGNLYPPDLLTEREKYHVLHHMWQPLGPLGVEAVDYIDRELYTIREVEGDPVRETPIPPQGLLVNRFHRGILPIPEGGGTIRLAIRGLEGRTAGTDQDRLRLRWFGPTASQRSVRDHFWSGDRTGIEGTFKGGLIEIETSRDIVIRVFLITDGDAEEITPDPFRVRTYRIGPGAPVVYDIAHWGEDPTPFRVDLRLFQPPEGAVGFPAGDPTVRYQLLDMANAVIGEGIIPVSAETTRLDWLSGNLSESLVSEPTTRFFNLAKEVARIRFASESPVMVSAYNRLYGMQKDVQVPDDYYAYPLRAEDRRPTWFSFRPVGHDRLVLDNRSLILTVQSRPPEIKPELEAGNYEWESFVPENAWRGRYLFTPREPGESIREEQLASIYRRLPANREIPLTFRAMAGGRRTVRPSLFFLRQAASPVRATLYLDGRLFYRISIAGKRGEIDLPPLTLGRKRVRLDSPPGIRWYINHAGGGPSPYLKRFAKRIGPGGSDRRLNFVYDKPGRTRDVLMVHLFSPLGGGEASTLRVRVGAGPRKVNSPFTDWSLLDRRYTVRPDRSGRADPAPVLHTRNEWTYPGRIFFLPLGADLSAGRYRVRFDLESGPGGYLIFSKITMGRYEKRDIYRELGGRG